MRIPLEVRIGAFILLFVGILIFVYFRLGYWRYTPKGYRIYCYFEELKGLVSGSPVLLQGKQVGYVEETDYDEKKGYPFARMFIREEFKIPVDSQFTVGIEAMIGEPKVMVQRGKSEKYLEDGDTVPEVGKARPTFEDLVAELTYQVKGISSSVQETLQRVNVLINQMRSQLQSLEEPLQATAEQLPALVSEIRSTVLSMQYQVEKTGKEIHNVGGEAQSLLIHLREQLTSTLHKVEQTVSHIQAVVEKMQATLEEEEVLQDLSDTVENFKKITEDLKKLSETLSSEETRKAISSTLKSVEKTAKKIEKGVEEFSSLRASLETRIYGLEEERKPIHRVHMEISSGRSSWYALAGEEQVKGKTRELWYVGAHSDFWKFGAGKRRGLPSLELALRKDPWSLESSFWFRSSPVSTHYQVLFSLQLEKHFALLAGVEKEKEAEILVGIRARF
ncbi:MAG: MlaD family protein [bacterium JZ-2024 1]